MAYHDRIGYSERETNVTIRIVLFEDKDGERLKRAIERFGGDDFEVTTFFPPTDLALAAAFDVKADLFFG